MTPLDLVLVGNLLVDDVVFDDGQTRMGVAGGALLHAARAATAWQARVGLVSVLGTDYPVAPLDELASRGASLDGLRRLAGPSTRVWLLYERGVRRMVMHLGRPTHDEASPRPDDLPASYRDARAVHVAPMPLDRQRDMVVACAGRGSLVALDPCEVLTEATFATFAGLARHTDVLFVSDDEVDLPDREQALTTLAQQGPRHVLHKRGRDGGVVFHGDGTPPTPWRAAPAREVDPTGAGDTFAAAFLVALVAGASLPDALARAAVTAAVTVEGPSSDTLLATPRAALEARLARLPSP